MQELLSSSHACGHINDGLRLGEKKGGEHLPNKQGFIKHRQPDDTDTPSLPSESLALQRTSIFMAARINHHQTMSCCKMVEEPPTVIVPV